MYSIYFAKGTTDWKIEAVRQDGTVWQGVWWRVPVKVSIKGIVILAKSLEEGGVVDYRRFRWGIVGDLQT